MNSLAQRRKAITKANHVRHEKSILKMELKAGTRSALEAMQSPIGQRMKCEELLRALPKMGPIKTRSVLASIPISGYRLVADLTDREKRLLSEALGRKA